MAKKPLLLLILLFSLCSSGCIGTGISRTGSTNDQNTTWYGKYPYKAVVDDVGFVGFVGSGVPEAPELSFFVLAGIISIPVDLVVDTVLLPVDLVGWACGKKKGNGFKNVVRGSTP